MVSITATPVNCITIINIDGRLALLHYYHKVNGDLLSSVTTITCNPSSIAIMDSRCLLSFTFRILTFYRREVWLLRFGLCISLLQANKIVFCYRVFFVGAEKWSKICITLHYIVVPQPLSLNFKKQEYYYEKCTVACGNRHDVSPIRRVKLRNYDWVYT